MKALVGAFNQEKALVGAFSVIVQPVVEPMEHCTALVKMAKLLADLEHGGEEVSVELLLEEVPGPHLLGVHVAEGARDQPSLLQILLTENQGT